MQPEIVLASASPRRAELLRRMGYRFRTIPASVDETLRPGASAEEETMRLAVAKAEAIAPTAPGAIIVAADTLVSLAGQVIGKPESRSGAVETLRRLSGTTHRVVTGVCVLDAPSGEQVVDSVSTAVTMRPMTDRQIRRYVARGESAGKAGAYAIQEGGDRYVTRVDGSFDNVVGLPTERLAEILDTFVSRKRQRSRQ
jgi:septum formation protein